MQKFRMIFTGFSSFKKKNPQEMGKIPAIQRGSKNYSTKHQGIFCASSVTTSDKGAALSCRNFVSQILNHDGSLTKLSQCQLHNKAVNARFVDLTH